MAESFQGRYRLVGQLQECGELPRHRVTGVTLAGTAEAVKVGGVGRWTGLAEAAWMREAARRAHPAVATRPLVAVEQDGDDLLIVHAPLPDLAWPEHAEGLDVPELPAALGPVVDLLIAGLSLGRGCGNLRLSTLRPSADELVVSPAAWALPPGLLAVRGHHGHGSRLLLALGDDGEARLDVALTCRDLAVWLARRIARERAAGGEAAVVPLSTLRSALLACGALARAGGPADELARSLRDACSGRVTAAPAKGRAELSDRAAGLAALARSPGPVLAEVAGRPPGERGLPCLLAAVVPGQAELSVAAGLCLETVLPPGAKRPASDGEAWLLIEDGGEMPPLGALRWLGRLQGRRPCVIVAAEGAASPGLDLLRRDLAARWGTAGPLARDESGADGPGAARERDGASAAGEGLDPAGAAVLGLLGLAGGALPLDLIGEATGLGPRGLGETAAALAAAGVVAQRVVQSPWRRTPAQAALVLTPTGRNAAAGRLRDEALRSSLLQLLRRRLPPGRGPDRRWLRFHLAVADGDGDTAARELAQILAASPTAESEAVVAAACAEAVAGGAELELDSSLRVQACHRLGLCWQERGLLDQALAVYRQGLAAPARASGRPMRPAEASALAGLAFDLADLLDKRGDFAALERLLADVAAACEPLLGSGERARLQFERAWAHHRLGRHDTALEICHALLRQLDVDEQPRETADVHNLIGLIRFESSLYEEARLSIQRGLVLRERLGDQAAVARSCNNLGMIHLALGDLARAEANLQRSMAIKAGAGDRPGVAICLLNLAYVALHQELLETARERGEEALGIGEEYGLRQLTAETHLLLGEVAEAQGRLADATEGYAAARQLAGGIGDADQQLAALRSEAALALRRGDAERAWSLFREAEGVAATVPSLLQRARLRELAGDLLSAAGDRAAAALAFEEAAAGLTTLHKPELLARARAKAALARARGGETERARELFEQVRAHATSARPGALPPEFAELESLLGAAGTGAGPVESAEWREPLLRALLAFPSLEAQHLDVAAHARRTAELLHAARVFAWVRFALVAPTGEEVGRWESGAHPGSAEPAMAVRDRWPDGVELLATAIPGDLLPRDTGRAVGRETLALAAASLASARARARIALPAPSSPAAARLSATVPGSTALLGNSEAMAELRRTIDTVASVDVTVLIHGENGSGKELVARLIHMRSPRAGEPFLAVNCAGIPDRLLESTLFGHERGAFTDARARHLGDFERVGAGTLLLDEVGELPLDLQAKLLRVLQEREFSRVGGEERLRLRARVLAATNRDLERAVDDGRFRKDLYFRLAVVPLPVPSLRERPTDVPLLLRHFLEVYAADFGVPVCEITAEAMEALAAASWPGNVRQLQNLARRLLIFSEGRPVRRADLPPGVLRGEVAAAREDLSLEALAERLARSHECSPARPLLPRLQALLARQMVARCGDNKAQAARMLGISIPTLYKWLRRPAVAGGLSEERRAKEAHA